MRHFSQILLLLLSVCIGSTNTTDNYEKEVLIENVNMDQQSLVSVDIDKGESVYKISVNVEGEINGNAKFGVFTISSGKVSMTKVFDHYAPEYLLKYQSLDASEGNLTFTIKFLTF